jgi:hypothetical protein
LFSIPELQLAKPKRGRAPEQEPSRGRPSVPCSGPALFLEWGHLLTVETVNWEDGGSPSESPVHSPLFVHLYGTSPVTGQHQSCPLELQWERPQDKGQ